MLASRILFVIIWIVIFPLIVHAQSSSKVDSLKNELNNKEDLLEKMKIAEEISLAFKDMQPDSARKYARRMLDYARLAENNKGMAMANNWLGESYYLKGEYDSAMFYFRASNRLFGETGPSDSWAKSLMVMANVYIMTDRLDSALILEQQALDYQLAEGLSVSAGKTLVNMSFVYSRKGKYAKALELLFAGLVRFEKGGDNYWRNISLSRMGSLYAQMDRFDSAIFVYEKAMPYWDSIGNHFALSEDLNNIGTIYEAQGKLDDALKVYKQAMKYRMAMNNQYGIAVSNMNIASVFMLKDQLDSALYYLDPAIIFFRKNKNIHPYVHALRLKGNILSLQTKLTESLEITSEAFQIAIENGFLEQQKDLAQKMSMLYEEMKDYPKALEYERIFKARADSILNEENIQRQTRAEEQYKHDLQMLEKENELMHEKKSRLYTIITAVGALAIILLIVFYRWRIHKDRLKRLEQENYIRSQKIRLETQMQERQRVARILHDNLAHLIGIVRKSVGTVRKNIENEQEREDLVKVEENLELMDKLARVASYELSFSYVLKDNLGAQCKRYIERVQHSQTARIVFEMEENSGIEKLSDEIKIDLFSAFQELLGNAIKHSNASNIHIYLYSDEEHTVLRVEDDGKGFDISEERHGQGFGNMDERAKKLDGDFRFESEKGFGTKARFMIPKAF